MATSPEIPIAATREQRASFGRDAPSSVARLGSSATAMRILLVSDNAQLRTSLCEALAAHLYDVVAVGGAPPPAPRRGDWDAAIIDAAATRAVARWLRIFDGVPGVPTIAIETRSGAAAEELWDRVDAVLHDPFDAQKLVLIVRGLFAGRRRIATRDDEALTVGPITLAPLLNAATVEARDVALTNVETRLLRELMLAASTPVSRERLTRYGVGRAWSPNDRTLDTHIKRLRRKIGRDRQGRNPIRTVRGLGYLLLAEWRPAR